MHTGIDALYLSVLLLILLTQEGSNVTDRFAITQTLQDYVVNVEGDGGTFEDINTMNDFGTWLYTGFFAGFDSAGSRGGLTWKMKTYNTVHVYVHVCMCIATEHGLDLTTSDLT